MKKHISPERAAERMAAHQVVAVLRAAAERAGAESTVPKAVAAGWSACHADPGLINEVFRAWAAGEDYAGPLPDLGAVLRRRYRRGTPADIAASLRHAAEVAP